VQDKTLSLVNGGVSVVDSPISNCGAVVMSLGRCFGILKDVVVWESLESD
jgi:hypothetical protein